MQSKVHPRYKTKYRVANWPAYNQALVRGYYALSPKGVREVSRWTAALTGQ